MTKMKTFMRKLFRKSNDNGIGHGAAMDDAMAHRGLQLRLRKAVTMGKPRQVAALLDEGASPIWMESEDRHRSHRRHNSNAPELNALLLACRRGDVQVLSLLLDAFFLEPQVLAHFSRAMYCLVIRHDHWNAFMRLQQRRVPMIAVSSGSSDSPTSASSSEFLHSAVMASTSSKLPLPIFVAAEHGRHHILSHLLRHYPRNWAHYSFEGQSLLTVASRNGHYECVEVLLAQHAATGAALDTAIVIARRHRQAHVLVLLTSCLPEYCSDPEPVFKSYTEPVMSSNNGNTITHASISSYTSQQMQWRNPVTRVGGRGSIAETVASESDDDSRRSSLLLVNSPINLNRAEELRRAEEMRSRAEMEREQRQSGMMWLLDGRSPIEDIQRHVDPLGQTLDGFAVLKSARDVQRHGDEEYSCLSEEEAAWYAVKSSEKGRLHDDLLQANDPEETPDEPPISVHEREVNKTHKAEAPQSAGKLQMMNAPIVVPTPRSSPLIRSSTSRKLISVRSRGFRKHRSLAAIDEDPAGETEA
ncbi:hypothetical protein BBJ28_00022144 [Nothophytophthora sp. Chile5]|nr:hypothetical protein BBJ28_00022144 [Nothophytophthora sp. Chile5]